MQSASNLHGVNSKCVAVSCDGVVPPPGMRLGIDKSPRASALSNCEFFRGLWFKSTVNTNLANQVVCRCLQCPASPAVAPSCPSPPRLCNSASWTPQLSRSQDMAAAWDQKIRFASEKALTWHWHLQRQTERENPCLCVRHALESFNFCRPSMAELLRSARCLVTYKLLFASHTF